MVEVLFRFGNDDAGQADQGDQVRDSHEAVYDVGEYPDSFEFQKCAGSYEADEDEAVGQDAFNAEEVLAGAFTVVVPAEDGGEGKQCE